MRYSRIIATALLGTLVLLSTSVWSLAAERSKISVMAWYPSTEGDIALMLEKFDTKHPDIELDFQYIAWGGAKAYWEKALTLAAAGSLPDVLAVPFVYSKQAMVEGIYTDLTPFLERDKGLFNIRDIMPPFDQLGQLGGRQYTVPYLGASVMWTSYNKPFFAEAGLPTPLELVDSNQWDLDSMMLAARKMTQVTADSRVLRTGLNCMSSFSEGYTQWMWANGSEVMENDLLQLDTERNVDIMTRMKEWLDQSIMSFALEPHKAGMLVWWDGIITYIQHYMNVDKGTYDQVPFPARTGVAPQGLINANVVGITKQAKNQDAAWKVFTYLSREGSEAMFSMVHGGIPVRSSHIPAFVKVRRGFGIEGNRLLGTPVAAMRPGDRVPEAVETLVQQEISSIWSGAKNAKEALAEATRRGNALLGK